MLLKYSALKCFLRNDRKEVLKVGRKFLVG